MRSWCIMLYRSSLLLACLLMIDANMWRDLETVSWCTWDVGSIFCATFSRASCITLMMASGVSGSVLVLIAPCPISNLVPSQCPPTHGALLNGLSVCSSGEE